MSFNRLAGLAAALLVALVPLDAVAQCTRDTDCKGDRVCVKGECVAPSAVNGALPSPSREVPGNPDPGWARAAGGIAVGAQVAAVALTVIGAMMIVPDDAAHTQTYLNKDGLPLVIAAGALGAIAAPVAFVGGRSARESSPSVRGVPALRVLGWVFYGLYLVAYGLDSIAVGADLYKQAGWGIALHAITSLDLTFFAIDGFVAASQADRLAERKRAKPTSSGGLQLSPAFSLARNSAGGLSPTLGLAASF
jgi:hypothetical protein